MISSKSNGPSLAAVVRGDEVQVTNAALGVVSARDVAIKNGGAVAVLAGDGVQLVNGYCQWMLSGESAALTNAGASAVVAGGEMSLTKAGGALLVAGNGMKMETSGAAALVTGKAEIRNSYVGLVVSGKTSLGEGARVLLGTREAIIFGVVFAIALRLLGLGGTKRKPGRYPQALSAIIAGRRASSGG